MNYCPKCGKEQLQKGNFCFHCGNSFTDEESTSSTEQTVPFYKKNPKLWIGLSIGILLAAAVFLYFTKPNDEKAIYRLIEEHDEAYQKGDYETWINTYDSKAYLATPYRDKDYFLQFNSEESFHANRDAEIESGSIKYRVQPKKLVEVPESFFEFMEEENIPKEQFKAVLVTIPFLDDGELVKEDLVYILRKDKEWKFFTGWMLDEEE